MTNIANRGSLPTSGAYVLRAGEGLSHLVAGQVIRTLAGIDQTAGGFGAVVVECPLDRGPIPMHWHEREHDTWFVTRGRLQVWADDQSRVLAPGDFAYVPPRVTHSYRSVAPRTQFFGIVAPGGWEQFFVDAGEVWGMTGLPADGHPFDFSRMGPAMGKHRIMRVDDPVYVDATPIGAGDQALVADQSAYFLEAGFGTRHVLLGHLSTAVLTQAQTDGLVDMRVIEGGRDAEMPTLRHGTTHVFLYLLDGQVEVTIDGEEHRLTAGDAANIPAGSTYATRILSGNARWLATSSGGNGAGLWPTAGTETAAFSFALDSDHNSDAARLGTVDGVDVTIG
ncbi:cupin domain-containing protein [Sphingomonas sp. CFBP 13706]|uniref:cupin domain-containing protein n=1 Tax=Sphingomonas sp. CFBP 13706 TaxID=2775314 RepID=UPI001786137C|nr:quercetin 2,3-dioxygenase family protein [Sphingomonas sp. CFBP 13706]MBD8737231.1 quercetin 2,3-dioxygenase family protein [Sphingomonas sp. CFBP 13706]